MLLSQELVISSKKVPCTFFAVFLIHLLSSAPLYSQNLTFSGLMEFTMPMRAGTTDESAFSWGFEEYANLRIQAKFADKAAIYGAVNVLVAGDMANMAYRNGAGNQNGWALSVLSSSDNHVAGLELERLYLKLNGEYLDFEGGLLRLPFGYGQIWGPSDFLNPKNPLYPDARPRPVLGAGLSWYPSDTSKLLGFSAMPREPSSDRGNTALAGLLAEQHWDKASVQGLYAFETRQTGYDQGLHRFGLSVKADLELGFLVDALYILNPDDMNGIGGLSLSAGADYSLFGGKFLVLAEYLYNGETSSTSIRGGGGLSNRHYLYTGLTFVISDYTNTGLALISAFDDLSFTPVITLNHDLFQGCSLILQARVPLDQDLFSGNGKTGEFGPYTQKNYCNCSAKVRLKF